MPQPNRWRKRIKDILASAEFDIPVTVKGWIKTRRGSRKISFIEVNDGSTLDNIQVVADASLPNYAEIEKLSVGCCVRVEGKLVKSQGKGQTVEVQASEIFVYGWADPESYPLQKKATSLEFLRQFRLDLMFVIGWSQLLGREALAIASGGVIGFHPTLLPVGRGRAPIPWTLIHGFKRSGATLFYLDEGVDSGDIIAQREFEIGLEDTAWTVYQKAVVALEEILRAYFSLLREGRAPRIPQDHRRATYWPRRGPEDGWIRWDRPTLEAYNWVRGLTHPYPGAFTSIGRHKLIVWRAALSSLPNGRPEPGTVSNVIEGKGFGVATGDGELLVTRAQMGAGIEEAAWALVEQYGITPGTRLGVYEVTALIGEGRRGRPAHYAV